MKRIVFICLLIPVLCAAQPASRWTAEKANAWYAKQPFLVGCNYAPAYAINELEMWQAPTWDAAAIDRELGWAESIGMNTLRVFLHDLLWSYDQEGFVKRLNEFLALCEKHKIRPMLVLFDSVWDPAPKLGTQHEPVPGVHNSGWVQSPGAAALTNPKEYARLEAYVKGVVSRFANDPRVLAWDIWNEPDNVNTNNYKEPSNKVALITKLLPMAFQWARSANPSQPLTTGVWKINWNEFKGYSSFEQMQIDQSDIISFHNYSDPGTFSKSVSILSGEKRPLFCTEYLARGFKSTFEGILPLGKKDKIAMINWGFVKGKTQTHLPWDSWQKPYTGGREPAVWHHEIFHPDGKPYDEKEVALIRELTKP